MKLEKFLDSKPLYYDKIDYKRMPKAYESIKKYFTLPKIIHIVGTNGKGSTGRFIADILYHKGFKVGHYSSPHIFSFNERIWINGRDIDDETLEKYHKKLQNILSKVYIDTLSYFEYTTLLAMFIFQDFCDFVILEAGLGGERDATNVFPKILSVITPIGYDHQSFLGNTIEDIATTKLNSIDRVAIISKQYEDVVYDIAKKLSFEKKFHLYKSEEYLLQNELEMIDNYIIKNRLPSFQSSNLQTAMSTIKFLGYDTTDFVDLKFETLNGRFQKISDNIIVDVGHNVMAAKAIRDNFIGKKVVLVYNSFKDKDYKKILEIFFPVIKRVEIYEIKSEREMANLEIGRFLKQNDIPFQNFKKIDDSEKYLIFGSFVVIEDFLNKFEKRFER